MAPIMFLIYQHLAFSGEYWSSSSLNRAIDILWVALPPFGFQSMNINDFFLLFFSQVLSMISDEAIHCRNILKILLLTLLLNFL